VLEVNSTLVVLNLSMNRVDDRAFMSLAAALGKNQGLRHLNLARNWITEESALILRDMLDSSLTLQSIVLDGNPLGYIGGRLVVGHLLRHPEKRISIEHCAFTPHAMQQKGAAGTSRERGFGFNLDDASGYYELDLSNPQHRATLRFLAELYYKERAAKEALGMEEGEKHGRGGPHGPDGRTSSRVLIGREYDAELGRIVGSPQSVAYLGLDEDGLAADGRSFDLMGAIGLDWASANVPESGLLSFYIGVYGSTPTAAFVTPPSVSSNLLTLLKNTDDVTKLQLLELAAGEIMIRAVELPSILDLFWSPEDRVQVIRAILTPIHVTFTPFQPRFTSHSRHFNPDSRHIHAD